MSANHRDPVELSHVIGLCLTKDIEKNTRLILDDLERCPKTK